MSWIQWFLKSVALNWHLGGEYFGQKSIRLLDVEKIVKLGCQVSERRIIWCCISNKHFLKSALMYCSFFFFCIVLKNVIRPVTTYVVSCNVLSSSAFCWLMSLSQVWWRQWSWDEGRPTCILRTIEKWKPRAPSCVLLTLQLKCYEVVREARW